MASRGRQFLLACALCVTASIAVADLPSPSLNLRLTAPIKTWDEAIPLGNGTMGLLPKKEALKLSREQEKLEKIPWI